MSEKENRLERRQQEELAKMQWETDFRKKAEAAIKSNESIQEYLRQFTPSSVSSFLESYLTYKTMWHRHGDFYLRDKDRHDMQWIEAANNHLENIQQKKLFNLQCLWRAEQVQLPDIQVCYDFNLWGDNILNCPFVDPISEDEVDLYREYLLQDSVDIENNLSFSFVSWQDYDDLKESYHSETEREYYPEWYEFYDNRKGTTGYLSLPDIRGDKEEFYRKIARDNDPARNGSLEKATKGQPQRDTRPCMSFFDSEITDHFVKTFEDKTTKELYKAYTWNNRNSGEREELDEVIEMLLAADEYIPVEAHYDLRTAIYNAAARYRAKKISEAMPDAFVQYQLNLSMNIAFPLKGKLYMEPKEIIMRDIFTGRRLSGEPEDLNF
ncbi:MAG: hypothetical protein ABL876_16360 [Chitinophagaceae bacterium]